MIHCDRAVLGTMTFGDTVDEAMSERILRAALEGGVTHIDTANVYTDGRSEEILGRLLPRDRSGLTIATKAGMPHPDIGERAPLSRQAIVTAVEASLRRLRTDRVDILYLHKPDAATPIEETLETVDELVRAGAVGRLGVSNFAAWQIEEIRHLLGAGAAAAGLVAQQLYSPLARRAEDEYAAFARHRRLTTYAYSPLAGGLLTGRHSESDAPGTGRFGSSRLGQVYRDRYWHRQMFRALDELHAIADGAGLTLAELSLRWVGHADFVSGVLIGASRPDHVTQSLAALAQGRLPHDVAAAVAVATEPLRGVMPSYNR